MEKYEINLMERYATVFKALSDMTRLRIMWLLISIDSKISVSEIIDVLGESQYNVSKHLKVLKNAGLVYEKKEGKWALYHYHPGIDMFDKAIRGAIVTIPNDILDKETERCRKRLAMRVDGKCVYGADSDEWNRITNDNVLK